MPTTTGYETTKKHILRISDIADDLSREYVDPRTGEPYFKYFISAAGVSLGSSGQPDFGSNKGILVMEFEQSENGLPEGFSITEVKETLRQRIGDIPGAERLSLESSFADFGRPISISLFGDDVEQITNCLLYTSPSPRDLSTSRMPSSA